MKFFRNESYKFLLKKIRLYLKNQKFDEGNDRKREIVLVKLYLKEQVEEEARHPFIIL